MNRTLTPVKEGFHPDRKSYPDPVPTFPSFLPPVSSNPSLLESYGLKRGLGSDPRSQDMFLMNGQGV